MRNNSYEDETLEDLIALVIMMAQIQPADENAVTEPNYDAKLLVRDSREKRALFTTPIAAKYKNLGATYVVAKSRLSVAKTPTTTNKVSSALSISLDSSQNLDDLFGPLYEEYYATSTPEVSDNSTANTLDNEDAPSSSLIVVEKDEAP
nr:hypothetical protein [Tanacetum cinerariifolium]